MSDNFDAIKKIHSKENCEDTPVLDDKKDDKLMPKTVQEGKQWIAALLLCFFLGGFGTHRFYTGKNMSANIMLLFWAIGTITLGALIGVQLLAGEVPLPSSVIDIIAFTGLIFFVIAEIWALSDFLSILRGNFKAANGQELIK